MPEQVLPALAKINLFLHVTGRRDDGYHLLESLAVFADCGETVTLAPAAHTSVIASGPFADALPQDGTDTLSRAVAAFERAIDAPFPCRITVHKAIPAGAGLGGGSADAAAVVRGLLQLSGQTLSPDALRDLAVRIGADVPVCLLSQAAMMRGIGEDVTPCPLPEPLAAVLVNPGIPVATAAIFAHRTGDFRAPLASAATEILRIDTFRTLVENTANDLEPAALGVYPAIGAALAALRAQGGCWLARMTGSGSTCFGLFEDHATATAAAERLCTQFPWVRAVTCA
jgi:4-diphosphocytidyl-2-C-methyl-D-erythritol kinase